MKHNHIFFFLLSNLLYRNYTSSLKTTTGSYAKRELRSYAKSYARLFTHGFQERVTELRWQLRA